MEARVGHFSVPGLAEVRAEPILNPVSKSPHRARVTLPHGFEYIEAEFANSVTRDARTRVVRMAARACPFRAAASHAPRAGPLGGISMLRRRPSSACSGAIGSSSSRRCCGDHRLLGVRARRRGHGHVVARNHRHDGAPARPARKMPRLRSTCPRWIGYARDMRHGSDMPGMAMGEGAERMWTWRSRRWRRPPGRPATPS